MTSSPHFFGVGHRKLSVKDVRLAERVDKDHGADLVQVKLPDGSWCYWFETPNRGDPFNRDVQRAVMQDPRMLGWAS